MEVRTISIMLSRISMDGLLNLLK